MSDARSRAARVREPNGWVYRSSSVVGDGRGCLLSSSRSGPVRWGLVSGGRGAGDPLFSATACSGSVSSLSLLWRWVGRGGVWIDTMNAHVRSRYGRARSRGKRRGYRHGASCVQRRAQLRHPGRGGYNRYQRYFVQRTWFWVVAYGTPVYAARSPAERSGRRGPAGAGTPRGRGRVGIIGYAYGFGCAGGRGDPTVYYMYTLSR